MDIKYYHSLDPIDHFRIKVVVEKVKEIQSLLVFSFDDDEERPIETDSKVIVDLNWQQKVFSPEEIAKYSTPSTKWASNKDIEYHKEVMKMSHKRRTRAINLVNDGEEIYSLSKKETKIRIFTYIDSDEYMPVKDTTLTPLIKNEIVSTLAERAEGLRYPKKIKGNLETNQEFSRHISDYPVHQDQSVFDSSYIEMNIMIYFPKTRIENKENDFFPAKEVRISRIRWYSTGMISMMPGVNKNNIKHKFQHNKINYLYTLENISEQFSEFDQQKEWEIYEEFFKRNAVMKHKLIGTSFNILPETYFTRLDIFGEIVSASKFDTENPLYVRYLWDAPFDWVPEGNLMGSSQKGLPIFDVKSSCHEVRYGMPFEISLFLKVKDINETIKLYLEIFSVDYWDRHILEGYGYISITGDPGISTFTVNTWRPLENPIDKLRAFFVGGSKEFYDLSYLSIPNDHERDTKLNKFGFQTETTGEISVRFNCVHQRSKSKLRNIFDKSFGFDQFDQSKVYGSGQLKMISDALSRARARLALLKSSKKDD